MKLSSIAALLALGVYGQDAAPAPTAPAPTAPAPTAESPTTTAAGTTTPTGTDDAEVEKVCVPGTPWTKEELAERDASFEPWGAKCEKTFSYQYIFGQGAYNWRGFNVIDSWKESGKIVGRVDGQTGWTGVNQFGEKTMSYQIAIIVKAN